MPKISNIRICQACGSLLKVSEMGYDPTDFRSYCRDFDQCEHKKHPNSPENIRKRGEKLEFLSPRIDEFLVQIRYLFNGELLEDLERLIGKPSSVRMNPTQTLAVAKLKEARRFRSMNQALCEIINYYIEREHTGEPLKVKPTHYYPIEREPKAEPETKSDESEDIII